MRLWSVGKHGKRKRGKEENRKKRGTEEDNGVSEEEKAFLYRCDVHHWPLDRWILIRSIQGTKSRIRVMSTWKQRRARKNRQGVVDGDSFSSFPMDTLFAFLCSFPLPFTPPYDPIGPFFYVRFGLPSDNRK
jgi:hypothetical protein